ncbi:hypothetical protein [Denitrobaculum tricleocarpae]|uniref:hypothetical protein n=1 Tax=Denitrobaculum tricleocarpae TaxID=2591009 RepID=UPI0015D10F8D|nr:hypothetical protein [Denitrobaculum tricleocarpae]
MVLLAPVENLHLMSPEAGNAVAQRWAERSQTLSRFRTWPEKQVAVPCSIPQRTQSLTEGLPELVLRVPGLRVPGLQVSMRRVSARRVSQVKTVRPPQPKFRPAQVPAVAAVVLRARLQAPRALAPPEVRQVRVWVGPQAQPELAEL